MKGKTSWRILGCLQEWVKIVVGRKYEGIGDKRGGGLIRSQDVEEENAKLTPSSQKVEG